MQGQRSAIGSLPETLGFDHGSTSNDPVVDPQICWNNMRNTSQNDTSITYMNSVNQEGPSLSGWNIGEPSSSGTQNQVGHNDPKIENNWLSSMNDCNGAGPIFEERQYELSNNLSLNNANNIDISNSHLGNCTSDSVPQDLNMTSGFVGPSVDDNQEIYIPNPYTASSSENLPVPSPDSMPDYLVEENEGRRLSCKRKALEGQSSGSGSSSYFHRGEGSVWHPGYANRNGNSGLSISEVNPRLGLGVGGVSSESRPIALNAAAQSVETTRRNLRLRINASSNQQDSIIPTNNTFSSPHHLLRLHPLNNLDLAAPPPPLPPAAAAAADTGIPQAPRRNLQLSRWSRGSSSRSGGSSGGFLDSSAHEEANSRTIPRNISEHPVFIPPSQSLVDWSFNGSENLIVNGNGASTSRVGPSSGVHPSSAAPNWVPHHRHTSHYPRRLRELVHRSLMASAASESGAQSGNFTAPSSQELPSLSGDQGRRVLHSRSAMLLDRQLEGTFGIPYSMRTLAGAGEGRSRLVSEHIRNVLDIMRRGEGLRFEDVMILDQSVFFGMADVHDRHRDMRLDVDNMSYEELLALEERIGNVNTGLSEETISTRLKQRKYVCVSTGLVETEPCCVCQEEYNTGEDLGTLDCGHDFHSECIKQWLMRKNLCPICKTTALIT